MISLSRKCAMSRKHKENTTAEFKGNFIMVTQSGEDHFKDRLYIYWDINTVCNYKCSYCYARAKYERGGLWSKQPAERDQKLILLSIKSSTLPVYLGFHGGEPSLHPNFESLVESTLDALTHELSLLYIATNLSRVNRIIELPKTDKIRILASFHPEYADPYEFVESVLKVSQRFKIKVNVLLHTDKRYWDSLHYVYDTCSSHNITAHPHFIYDQEGDKEILWNYTPDFYAEFNYMKNTPCKYVFTTDGSTNVVTDVEMFEQNLNRFKGWYCYNNNYEILVDNTVRRLCTNDLIDITKDPLFFRRICKIKPMICPFDNCSSDGVLKCLKHSP